MQLIINITEHEKSVIDRYVDGHGYSYKDLTRTTVIESLAQAVHKGIPLPKGHGRLIDADALEKEISCGIKAGNLEEGYEHYANINDMDDCVECIKYASTIIEADRSEVEE